MTENQACNQECIEKGGFGIVFNPPLSFPQEKESVGKVFYSTKYAITEIHIGRFLSSIDLINEYFIYPLSYSEILIPNLDELLNDNLFDFLNKHLEANEKKKPIKLYQNIMPKGGINIMEYLRKNNLILSRLDLLKLLSNVFQGIKKLNKSGYIHQDIKYTNILICPDSKKVRIIDFGLLMYKDNLFNTDLSLYNEYLSTFQFSSGEPLSFVNFYNKFSKKIRTNYLLDENILNFVNPPEYILYSLKPEELELMSVEKMRKWLIGNKLNESINEDNGVDWDNLYEDLYKRNLLDYYLGVEKGYKQDVFLKRIKRIKYEDRKEYFMKKKIYEKSDTFSLGILILELSKYLKHSDLDDPKIVKLFDKLMLGLLDFDPIKRLNINKAMIILEKVRGITIKPSKTSLLKF